MISIRSSADLTRVLNGCLEPHLRGLLTLRRDQLIGDGEEDLGDLVHFIVVRDGDTLAAVEAEAGVALSINPIDGRRLGDPDFEPLFDLVRREHGFLEAITCCIYMTGDQRRSRYPVILIPNFAVC